MDWALVTAITIPIHHIGLIKLFDWHGKDRNDPKSVRRRFSAIVVSCFIAVASVYWALSLDSLSSLASILGVRYPCYSIGVVVSIVVHTCIFFTPNIIDGIVDWDWLYIKGTVQEITWVRNTFMAPVCEELAFRACAGQLVASSLGRTPSIWLTPLLFALSHLHLVADDRRHGYGLAEALKMRSFQVIYTYVFGVYATVLFFRTGDILAPIVCHSICNNFGLPIIVELSERPSSMYRTLLIIVSFVGLALFIASFSSFVPSQ